MIIQKYEKNGLIGKYDVVKTNDPDGKKWRKMMFGGGE